MEHYLGDSEDEVCIPYLEDVIGFSKIFEAHIDDFSNSAAKIKES